ncbi:MAG: hypothetical protein Q8K40_02150, partial [Ignavibacteria bacterium]|nr:hypothetical protein [Ignavibacteria bacterium]
RSQITIKSEEQFYIVTLDEGLYFQYYDFTLSLTRTATNVSNFSNGPYTLHPRDGRPSLESQVMSLSEDYKKNGTSKSIVVCDDAVGKYGLTIRRIIELLNKHDLLVSLIYVLVNKDRKNNLLGVKIDSILFDTYFINERDLYWGLPLSGVSCLYDSQMFGIPTTIDFETILNRIYPVSSRHLAGFRECVLDFNIKFWTLLENYSKQYIFFNECPRLRSMPVFLGFPNKRIIDFIKEIKIPMTKISF